MDKRRIKKMKKKGGGYMVVTLNIKENYSTNSKLSELRERALKRKNVYGNNIPDKDATKVANDNFKDLEQLIYSTIKE